MVGAAPNRAVIQRAATWDEAKVPETDYSMRQPGGGDILTFIMDTKVGKAKQILFYYQPLSLRLNYCYVTKQQFNIGACRISNILRELLMFCPQVYKMQALTVCWKASTSLNVNIDKMDQYLITLNSFNFCPIL